MTTPSTSRRPGNNWNLLYDQLQRLATLHPECGHNGKTLYVVAQEWAAVLEHEEASTAEFLDALAVVKRRCKFFPTPADLVEGLREIREHPPRIPEQMRLPEPEFTPEKQARVRACCAIIAAQLARQITPDEASRRLNAACRV